MLDEKLCQKLGNIKAFNISYSDQIRIFEQ